MMDLLSISLKCVCISLSDYGFSGVFFGVGDSVSINSQVSAQFAIESGEVGSQNRVKELRKSPVVSLKTHRVRVVFQISGIHAGCSTR